jgi:hypothetical protein
MRHTLAMCSGALFVSLASAANAQEIPISGPLAGAPAGPCRGNTCPTEQGIAFTLHGMTGAFIADGQPMEVAPGGATGVDLGELAPTLEGEAAYIGSGLRVFFQGENMRLGGAIGALLVNRGLTQVHAAPPSGYTLRPDSSIGGHFEVFAGGQIDFRPLFPYLDAVGWLDIVHTDYELFGQGGTKVGEPAWNAYALGVGPRLGVIIPISSHVYLDLAATGGVIGMNRFLFTAGFGYTSGARPTRDPEE